MKTSIFSLFFAVTIAVSAQAADGMVDIESTFTVKETADRMEHILKEKGMTVFNRIDHAQGAGNVGVELRDTELLVFGNPKVGSPLMKCRQSVAIDLPQKALIWQDEENKVWISYNEPGYLAKRHDITGCEEVISKIEQALAGMATSAAKE
ncbi:DUF302 domain-containing protein [Oceanisphaera arctica]|uniref:DUF302 domain-containing protein n=1 Tax=Oceanisphaera arctica TaxID=641510 RepID=A0A2P5TN00_9GAMM|nr:DUF302 domain-containing protein [Oceanisphaera arctica]PPL16861.1 hypothetical protein UN63_06970 [Oceanisphaera arctica]GHA19685.1 hypothetical protein GCM10007082_20450 [Oceanisphaera arctica]